MPEFFTLVLLSVLAGVLTIIAPCIISLLPIMLGSSLGGGSKWRPAFVVLGMIVSFAGFGFIFSAFTSFLGLSRETVRSLAVVLILLFGLSLTFEKQYDQLVIMLRGWWTKLTMAMRNGQPVQPEMPKVRNGLKGAFMLGASMGIAWVPCAGPILGIILTIATVEGNVVGGTILFLAYALGAGVPMLLIGYGGTWIVSRVRWLATKSEAIRRGAGIILLIMGIAILTGIDRKIETAAFDYFANTTTIEEKLLQNTFSGDDDMMDKSKTFPETNMPLLLPDLK